jgi:spore maturation protein CgeB
MRIAIVGAKGFDCLESNFEETLSHLGHLARIFDLDDAIPLVHKICGQAMYNILQANYGFSRWVWGKLANKVLDFSPELVIVTYRHVIPEFVQTLKAARKQLPVIHVNPDHVGTLRRQYIFMSPYDAYFTKEPFLAKLMKAKLGLNAFYLPESFNPRVHKKPDIPKTDYEETIDVDIVVVANLQPYRTKFLEQVLGIIGKDVNIAIYGAPQPIPWVKTSLYNHHKKKYLIGEEKAKVFYGAKIVLNDMHPAEFTGVNCRFFEALGSGGFLLNEYRPTLPELAVPGKEVEIFASAKEAAEKVLYFLDHPKERIAIAEAGYRRAMQDHTYEKRIENIFSTIR